MTYEQAQETKECYLHRKVDYMLFGIHLVGTIVKTEVVSTGKIGSYDVMCKVDYPDGIIIYTLTELKELHAFGKVEVAV